MLCPLAKDDETAWDHPVREKLYKTPGFGCSTLQGRSQIEEKNGTIAS